MLSEEQRDWVREAAASLAEHPLLREPPGAVASSPLGRESRKIFAELTRRAERELEKQLEPLRVVLCGEVKAGKSSILNKLVGRAVSPIGVLEATRCLIVVKHGEPHGAVLEFVDGSVERCAVDDVGARLRVEPIPRLVRICTDYAELGSVELVDTPGLSTISKHLEEITRAFSGEMDVVLWVLNANLLGSSEVDARLAAVADLGKPLALLVNRIDSVAAPDRERVRLHTKQEYGDLYDAPVFLVSATEQVEDDWQRFVEWLNQRVLGRAKEAHSDAISRSVAASVASARLVMDELVRNAEEAARREERHRTELAATRDQIVRRGMARLEDRVRNEMFGPQLAELKSLLSSGASRHEIKQALEQGFGEDACREAWMEVATATKADVEEMLRTRYRELAAELSDEAGSLIRDGETRFEAALARIAGPDAVVKGAKEAAAVAGAAGLALAAYSAVLGPAAATVSLGAALGAFLPPFLIAGAAIGAARAWIGKGKRREKQIQELESGVDRLRGKILSDARGSFQNALESEVDRAIGHLREASRKRLLGGSDQEAWANELEEYRAYALRMDGLLATSPFPRATP